MSYQYTNSTNTAVKDTNTGAIIPIDEGNRDYRNKVKPWLDQGNTPDPAEPEPTPTEPAPPTVMSRPRFTDLPTSSAGLQPGDAWNDNGAVKVV
jgi:hypothetical protein